MSRLEAISWRSVRRILAILFLLTLAGCSPRPAAPQQTKSDPTTESWYPAAIRQLAAFNRDAEALFRSGKYDQAATIITNAQPVENRLLSAPHPTLAALEASSDLDDLYGRMLLRNQQYGWARTFFQKNVTRWKTWKPATPETEQRWKQAVLALAECDRRLSE